MGKQKSKRVLRTCCRCRWTTNPIRSSEHRIRPSACGWPRQNGCERNACTNGISILRWLGASCIRPSCADAAAPNIAREIVLGTGMDINTMPVWHVLVQRASKRQLTSQRALALARLMSVLRWRLILLLYCQSAFRKKLAANLLALE